VVVVATALVTAYLAQVVVPGGDVAPIAGIAPSYGPKTVSPVPNAAAIVRRIWPHLLAARRVGTMRRLGIQHFTEAVRISVLAAKAVRALRRTATGILRR
jgi:hypothetical protein